MKAPKLAFAGLATAFALTACGGPPSNAEAQKALVTLLEQSGAGQISDVPEFQLNGCVEAKEAAGYRCDTSGKVTLDIAGRRVPVPIGKNLRYAREDGVWRAYAK
ncbi:TPA: hypothetical protein ACOENK_004104 [Stenotrophomonas maltophilia]|uniref:hypothetical protein n=1 Tax=Stenotrophomonas maltophilia group TaxID=995085 RepID=UPI00066DDD58|nr:hypothetical protein [Stenotrophomonas maltophilia]QGL87632.1 hypothetical protein FEO91_04625 [Stenotrophomonas maltophilia]HDS1513022.1 hypothetical protein [Stenotrophomonas maltophilia]HDS1537714.1 hypothetical protein [Stenotrophomonas maltophilia]HDS1577218.1 hypothetical protein [Stenotrophomonas maltophilia]HDS1613554.1 hypothetical protein [Stenotrophomonas maltophilia]